MRRSARRGRGPTHAFTLIEVMIAIGIFTVAMISILGVMSRGLSAARSLQIAGPDPGLVAAELTLTNQLEDGRSEKGDFGKLYPDYSYSYDMYEVASNGLFRVDIHIYHRKQGRAEEESLMSMLMYKPESVRSAFGGGGSLGGRR